MTEVVEITEDELAQKDLKSPPVASFVRPRPPGTRNSSQSRSSQGQSLLKPVTEKDEIDEDLSSSIRSFDGIDTEALKRLSAVDDSGRSNRTGLSTLTEGDKSQSSSSSSGSKRSVRPSRVKTMTDQTRQFGSGNGSLDSSERYSISSYEHLGSSMSLSSHAFSKSSISTIGLSFDLAEGEDPLITPPTGPKKGVPKMSPANASTFSMPSLAEFSTGASTSSMPALADFSLHSKSAHSSVMPSLGHIAEEDVSFSSASFASFNTGNSFSTGTNSDNVGIIIGGRPMSEILRDQEKMAGKTVDILSPTIPVKKPTTKRWTSEDTAVISNESPKQDGAPTVARRRISDNSSYSGFGELAEQGQSSDMPPQMIRRQDTNSSLSLRISDTSACYELGEHSPVPDRPPKMALRQDTASSEDIRISDASACHFAELAEYSPGPDVAPQVVVRQDTDSSTRMPDLSPLHLSGTRGRVKAVDESGRRTAMPELSPPRGDGTHRFSPEKEESTGRRRITKPKRVSSTDDDAEIAEIMLKSEPVGEEKAPPMKTKRSVSPKIWSRSGSRSFSKNDKPPIISKRKVSG